MSTSGRAVNPSGRPRSVTAATIAALAAAAWLVGGFLGPRGVDGARAATVLTLVMGASLVIFWRASAREPDAVLLMAVLAVSLVAKLAMAYFRWASGLLVDAYFYDDSGQEIARLLAAGQFQPGGLYGTQFLGLVTGALYYLFGPSFAGITILWSWLGLLGMLAFYKAFRLAFPQGHRLLYMGLIFLYPSILLWTSSLGKEPLMFFFLGLAVYGVARAHRGADAASLASLTVGGTGMFFIRPHVATIFAVAATVSMMVRRVGGFYGPLVRVGAVAVVTAVTFAVFTVGVRYVGLQDVSAETVFSFIEQRQARVDESAAAFQGINPRDPASLALVAPTVLFRPFPWEAGNTLAMASALEGVGLFLLMLARLRSITAALRGSLRQGVPLLVLVYVLLFIFLYSAIANFGILARQRVMLLPFVFMWLACAGPRRMPAGRPASGTAAGG